MFKNSLFLWQFLLKFGISSYIPKQQDAVLEELHNSCFIQEGIISVVLVKSLSLKIKLLL